MFPRAARLNINQSFQWVIKGQRFQTAALRLWWRSGENNQALVGVALSKKDFKRSVDRNRAKRLVFAAVMSVYPKLPKGINLVIMPNAKVLTDRFDDLKQQLENVKGLYLAN